MGEGDGTVSLLSLGAMCVEGWKRPRWNPARINVTTIEVSIFNVQAMSLEDFLYFLASASAYC
jgi:hypothetical protein